MAEKGKIPQDIREANRELIFKLLRKSAALSCTEIAKETGLSNAGVEKIVDGLVEKGLLVIKKEEYPKVKGRRPIRYCINGDAGAFAAFNFTDGYVSVADVAGKELFLERLPDSDGVYTREALCEFLDGLKAKCESENIRIAVSAVALVGKQRSGDGEIVFSKAFEEGINLKDIFENRLGVPAMITNDTYLALIAEMNCRKITDAVYIYFGNGISCAFVMGGLVYSGAGGFAGELGMLSFFGGEKYETELSKKVLEQIDETRDEREFASRTENIIAFLVNVCKIFDFRDVIIGGPYQTFSALAADKLNEKLAAEKFLATRASVAVSGSVGEGLFLSALGFAHSVLIRKLQ